MIIDIHTHVFPPEVRDERDGFLARDATFRELYSSPKARIATAEDLLAAMDAAGIDVSVACGFAWSDAELCRRHNDYLLEAASTSGGRIVPFCTAQPSDKGARDELKRCAAAGGRGLGELRPQSQGYSLIDSEEADLLAWAADAYDLALLFHTSEPAGHPYPGKGGLPVEQLARFIADFPGAAVIAAHWGGGLPFYALMPEVRAALSRTYFDTAAWSLLYDDESIARLVGLAGADRVLFGSDFPLLSPGRQIQRINAILPGDTAKAVCGGNADTLFSDMHD